MKGSRYFRAYKTTGGPSYPIGIDADDLDDALNQAKLHGCLCHKDILLIYEVDEGQSQKFLHAYVVRKTAAIYRKDPHSGLNRRVEQLEPRSLFSIPIEHFVPTRPFNAFTDDPVGADRNMVEHKG